MLYKASLRNAIYWKTKPRLRIDEPVLIPGFKTGQHEKILYWGWPDCIGKTWIGP